MNFGAPYYLWFLVAIPPAMLLFFWWSAREQRTLMTQFIHSRLLSGLLTGVSPARQKIRAVMLIAAVSCLILALARPQWGYDLEEVKQRGLDIVVAIDTSRSMLAEDVTPNRLARAKLATLDLMRQAKSDRLGLVAFAGTAFLQCPLTIDDAAFRQTLQTLDVGIIPQGGTALAEAITTAKRAFKEGDNYRVLVLFTDGEDHDSGAMDAARQAAESGMRIFTIGVGTAEGEVLRVRDANGQTGYVRDESGNVVKSHLDEKLLQEIADATGGAYLPLRAANAIDLLYERYLAPLPKSDLSEKWVKRLHEHYHWPLGAGILLLIAEIFFPERKRESNRRVGVLAAKSPFAATTAIVAILLLPAAVLGSSSSALREYKSGKFDESLKEYQRLLQDKKEDPRLYFNAGAAAYRNGQFDQAAKYFDQAMAVGRPDVNLLEHAYYNLGNSLYHIGEQNTDLDEKKGRWEEALKKYDSSLKLNPNDADAKFNSKFVKEKLEELKKQQEQQKQQQKDQNQGKDQQQDQQNQSSKNDQQQDQKNQQSKDQKDQKSDSSQQKDQDQNKQDAEQDQQSKTNSSSQPKEPPRPDQQSKTNRSSSKPGQSQEEGDEKRTPGQMTPAEAKQLLDAEKNDELLMPVSRSGQSGSQRGVLKDW